MMMHVKIFFIKQAKEWLKPISSPADVSLASTGLTNLRLNPKENTDSQAQWNAVKVDSLHKK